MVDVFAETRRLVSAQDAALHYGFTPNRAGFIPCPFHHEKTASLKLYPGTKGFYCFGCHMGGSVVDFVAQLFDLDALGAVRRLNEDFRLALPLDRPPDKAERAAAQHRREVADTYKLFEEWRDNLIQQLNTCFREGHLAMKSLETPADLDRLTDAQALAIRQQAYVEYLADTLTTGTMAEQMEIFRERGQIEQLCHRILNSTPMKSGVA